MKAKFVIFTVAMSLLIAACSSTTPTSDSDVAALTNDQDKSSQPAWQDDLTNLLNQSDPAQPQQLLSELVKLAGQYAQQNQCANTHAVLVGVWPSLTELSEHVQQLAKYWRAQCAHPQDSLETRLQLLTALSADANLQQQQLALRAQLHAKLLNYRAALIDGVRSGKYTTQQLWQWTLAISDEQLTLTQESRIDAYLSLLQLLRNEGLNNQNLSLAINTWQFRYQGHPLVNDLPIETTKLLLQNRHIEKIAVLLPLSGPLAEIGETLKAGMLAAYLAKPNSSLFFFDSMQMNAQRIAHLQTFPVVLGPLSKDQLSASQSWLLADQQQLALNTSTEQLVNQPVLFALNPEQEAQQLAELMWQQGITQPVMVYAHSRLGNRMAIQFQETWQMLSEQPDLLTVKYVDNDSMKDGISDILDVAQSRQRIALVEEYLGTELHAVTRNRRDVDAFVIFADAQQTQLINPIIESSLSSFSSATLPVYASSNSFAYATEKNALRDLQNIHFLDMPWLLNDALSNSSMPHRELKRAYQLAGLKQDVQQQRLFAFGYDAYHLLTHLDKLGVIDGLYYRGLSGALSLNGQGIIERRLNLAVVDKEQIVQP